MSRPVAVAGPRPLPEEGTAVVWIDTGSGPGYQREVDVSQLSLSPIDDGHGPCGYYLLHPPGEADRG